MKTLHRILYVNVEGVSHNKWDKTLKEAEKRLPELEGSIVYYDYIIPIMGGSSYLDIRVTETN